MILINLLMMEKISMTSVKKMPNDDIDREIFDLRQRFIEVFILENQDKALVKYLLELEDERTKRSEMQEN